MPPATSVRKETRRIAFRAVQSESLGFSFLYVFPVRNAVACVQVRDNVGAQVKQGHVECIWKILPGVTELGVVFSPIQGLWM